MKDTTTPPPWVLAEADRHHARIVSIVDEAVRLHREEINDRIAAGRSSDRMTTGGLLALDIIDRSGLVEHPLTLAMLLAVSLDKLARCEGVQA